MTYVLRIQNVENITLQMFYYISNDVYIHYHIHRILARIILCFAIRYTILRY